MLKKLAWETFKNTGNIKTYLELKQIENAENQIKDDLEIKENEPKNIENGQENVENEQKVFMVGNPDIAVFHVL